MKALSSKNVTSERHFEMTPLNVSLFEVFEICEVCEILCIPVKSVESVNSVSSVSIEAPLMVQQLDEALRSVKFTGAKVNPPAFKFVRKLRAINGLKGKDFDEIEDALALILQVWMRSVKDKVPMNFQESFKLEVEIIWDNVKRPWGESSLEDAINMAIERPYQHPTIELSGIESTIAAVCELLADDEGLFFLAVRDASKAVGMNGTSPGGPVLKSLCRKRLIELIRTGGKDVVDEDGNLKRKRFRSASDYRWIG